MLIPGRVTIWPRNITSPCIGCPVVVAWASVSICSRTTGQVVRDAQPVITVVDNSTGGTSQHVPVAVMVGAGQAMHDLHYGNNVVMLPGHTFTVLVAVGPEQATLKVMTPSSSPRSSTSSPGSPTPGGVTPGMSHG